jgi:hypothetical protein
MEKNHQLMGGDVQLFKRSNSQFWYCQASVGGRRHRISTKKDSLKVSIRRVPLRTGRLTGTF